MSKALNLMTAGIEKLLVDHPLYTHEKEQPENVRILVKYFTPWTKWTWYVTEGQKQEDGDWLFFGMIHGDEKELGYFRLSELQAIRGKIGGVPMLRIERDLYFGEHKLSEVMEKTI